MCGFSVHPELVEGWFDRLTMNGIIVKINLTKASITVIALRLTLRRWFSVSAAVRIVHQFGATEIFHAVLYFGN